MSRLSEDLGLEYLVENVSLGREYSVKTVLMLDYCYKNGEKVPKDYFSGFISKIVNKQVNNHSKPINLDESNLDHCLFLECFKSLLSSKTEGLVKAARTSQDFKAIIAIDLLCKKVDNPERILNSLISLESKVFDLVKAYQEANFEKNIKKEYSRMKEYSLMVNSDLKKPLNNELVHKLSKVKKDLDEMLKAYSKYPNTNLVSDVKKLVMDTKNAIDNRLKSYTEDAYHRYNKIKRIFEEGVWDSRRRINRLVGLRSELQDIKSKYQLMLHTKGVENCGSLDSKIKNAIYEYEYVQDKKEEFQDVKRKASDYYKEINYIFNEEICLSSIKRINSIYSDLRSLSNKEFNECVPPTWREDYYSNLERTMRFIKQKCVKRASFLINQSSKYRQKIDSSLFSWQTIKYAKRLEKCNTELEALSKCQII